VILLILLMPGASSLEFAICPLLIPILAPFVGCYVRSEREKEAERQRENQKQAKRVEQELLLAVQYALSRSRKPRRRSAGSIFMPVHRAITGSVAKSQLFRKRRVVDVGLTSGPHQLPCRPG
jgi:hypothetical protein